MEYLRQQNIVHRYPEALNILLESDNNAYAGDFGLSAGRRSRAALTI
jgi:serine/threonine protein kinase